MRVSAHSPEQYGAVAFHPRVKWLPAARHLGGEATGSGRIISNAFPARHEEVQDKDDKSDDEQEVDESTSDMKREPTAPEEQQKNGND